LNDHQWTNFLQFIKLYLALEEWFHDINDKDEVRITQGKISQILGILQKIFPRSDHTNGYCIPKMHGMTKMQFYIQLFGSGMIMVALVRPRTRHLSNQLAKKLSVGSVNLHNKQQINITICCCHHVLYKTLPTMLIALFR
jgi:hypothetical protein